MIEFVERVKYKVSLESHHCFICKDFTSETSKFTEHKAKITPRNWSYFFERALFFTNRASGKTKYMVQGTITN